MVGTACLPLGILRNVGLDNNTEHSEPWLADLGFQYISIASTIGMIIVVELGKFVFSVVIITYCTGRTGKLLQEFQVLPQTTKDKKGFVYGPYMCGSIHCVFHTLLPQFLILYGGEAINSFKTAPFLRALYFSI